MTGRLMTVTLAAMVAVTFAEIGVSTRAVLPRPDCDRTQPIAQGGLTHFPSGQADVFVTSQDRLFITNLGPSGSDGVCTVLPDWSGIMVNEPTPIRLRRDELLVLTFGSRDGRLLSVGVKQRPGDRMRGFMDYTDDALMAERTISRNGEVVASEVGLANGAFDVPGFLVEDFRFHGITGAFELGGPDRDGNQWRFAVTPVSGFVGAPVRRWAITLGTDLSGRSFLDGAGQGCDLQSCEVPGS